LFLYVVEILFSTKKWNTHAEMSNSTHAQDVLTLVSQKELVRASDLEAIYTVVAEKPCPAPRWRGANSRMKDYLDLSVLLQRESLVIDLLAQAVKATF
jgi:hypothetical protein